MSIYKRLPELIRTVGEELQFLLQPRIWGSVSVVVVVGIFFWQFSEHPEWFSLDQESTLDSGNSASQLTPEEQSIAADIDSSKVLLDELNHNNSFLAPLNTTISLGTDLFKQAQEAAKKPESSSNSNPLVDAILSESAPKTQPSISVQGNTSTPVNNLNSGSGNPSTPTESNPNIGLNQSAETTNPQTTTTALQQAMQNYLQTQQTENKDLAVPSNTATESSPTSEVQETKPSTLSPNTLTNPNAALNPLSGTPVGVTPFTATPTITGQAIQPSWSVPRANTNPVVGTVPLPAPNPYQTNVTLPPVVPTVPTVTPGTAPNPGYSNLNSLPINNTAPSYSVTPNTGSYSTVQPVQPNSYMTPSNMNPNLQPGQIGQTQPNFSVPNRVPGRYIGGGEINTFANP
ncbi:hypothetical protein PCC9214_02753 [Planktothrix tepida]|uniref:Uncharacterized protein n=1 Tax=Planktothrix tepida PCC 9214 TaxID=671072 RepID=A0A1J1LNX3_9CYAN|nr:hypothetical protein [Planktothrix tepida]CAD5954210.1 hypothetical protein PCC9214_02753 [Planktothrix tepida]CUR34248.1 conserved hypothetical protein [Planktothrix tepida PCC 9214]